LIIFKWCEVLVILIAKDGRIIRSLRESGFEMEAFLQQYIRDNPEIIPFNEINDVLCIDDKGGTI